MKFKPTVGLYVAVLAVIGLHTVVCGETTSFEENDGTVVSDNGTLVVKPDENPFAGVHAAYYLWYGNPASDGKWQHWNHEVLPHWSQSIRDRFPHGLTYSPPEETHSVYYPARGCYSSTDKRLLLEHFKEMKDYGIDVAVVSWWGRPDQAGTHDTQGVSTDDKIAAVLDAAAAAGVKVAFHLEPYVGRTAYTVRQDIVYITDKYGKHDALYRAKSKRDIVTDPLFAGRLLPVYYVYDSYHIKSMEWAQVLGPDGRHTVRGTRYDGLFIGLWLERTHGRELVQGGFDGAYTYFASDGFSFGSTSRHWSDMKTFCDNHGLLFVPSVGPGYDDTKIRPWNADNTRDRRNGDYYDNMFGAAVAVSPAAVFVTSYNEWGEGTQIEPAVPHTVPDGVGMSNEVLSKMDISRKYKDYSPRDPEAYLQQTLFWSQKLAQSQQAQHGSVERNEL